VLVAKPHRRRDSANAQSTASQQRLPGTILPYGRCFGQVHHRSEIGGFLVTDMSADPRLEIPRHTHDTAHMILVAEGAYLSGARGAPALCATLSAIFNPAGTTHRDRFLDAGGHYGGRFVSIWIDQRLMTLLAEDARFEDGPVYLTGGGIAAAARRIIRECRRYQDDSAIVIEGLCTELAARAARDHAFGASTAPGWLESALDYLHDDWRGISTIRQVADAAGVHPVHLARVFRRFVGCTPGDYTRRLRIERARTLLSATRVPLGDIAAMIGYSDQSHFTTAFRRAHGIPPAAYRRLRARA
jgi:AraC family transcriptional regulator